jgi:peroxiredoxin
MIKALYGQFKRWYAIPYVIMCILVTLQSASYHLGDNAFSLSWLGVSVAIGPLVVFMAVIYFLPWSGVANYIAVPFVTAFVGTVLAVIEMRPLPTFYSLFLGLGGVLVYIFWYSDLDRKDNPLLKIGSKLPDFTVKSIDDKELHSSVFLGRKTLFIFYRGNWCPVCQSQLQELAEQYQEIQRRGVAVVLISPQSAERSAELARRLDVEMQICVDEGNRAAKRLGIVHHYGVPLGFWGYGSDTVLPTALIVDESGSIVYADLTDNFRIIPRVQTLISALDGVW